jgi:trans-2,3-dihydro-3-hydroxyanthranilate isomerase
MTAMSAPAAERSYAFETVDVFTDRRFGGNQLAVFTDARGLTDTEMQAVAAEMNLSETTFVFPPANPAHSAHLRIFHRTGEMPFAGHPTLGTAYVLSQLGRFHGDTLLLEVKAGLVRVTLVRDAQGTVMSGEITAPQPLTTGEVVACDVVGACVGLVADAFVTSAHAPLVASVGTPYLIAEVRPEVLAMASPNLPAFRAAVDARPHFGGRLSVHLYAREGTHIRARMFAPIAGTWEDPATGSANAALAALLLQLSGTDADRYHIVQGVEMGRRSELFARATRGSDGILGAIGGRCVRVLSGTARI